MEVLELEVEKREKTGGSAAGVLRRSGKLPGVVYSEGKAATPFCVQTLGFEKMMAKSRSVQLFRFKSAAPELNGKMVLVKDLQIEPLRDDILHVDCLEVTEGHRIHIEVPLELMGESPAVKLGEAVLIQNMYEIEIECLPTEIPNSLALDVSSLAVGDSLHASDLVLPEGVRLRCEPNMTIVSTVAKAAEEAAPVAAPAAADAAAATDAAAADAKAEKAE